MESHAPSSNLRDGEIAQYDNAIRDFDAQVERVFGYLEARSLLDNTIIVLTSDHGARWSMRPRLPLVFLFPEQDRSTRIAANVQLIDIAPTLLDFIGHGVPRWMEGKSLLGPLPANRLALGFQRNPNRLGNHRWESESSDDVLPASEVLTMIRAVRCGLWHEFHTTGRTAESGEVVGFTRACTEEQNIPEPIFDEANNVEPHGLFSWMIVALAMRTVGLRI
jgi:hypothetical protein